MAVSRRLLLVPRPGHPGHYFNNRGSVKSTRWCFSSLTGETEKLKTEEAANEKRAVESSRKKDKEMHLAVSPKPTEIQNKVGESRYYFKGIFTSIKEKMLRNPQLIKERLSEASDSAIDNEFSDQQKTDNKCQFPEVKMNCYNKESVSSSSAGHVVGENCSDGAVETISDFMKNHKNILQSSGAITHVVNNDKSILMDVESHIIGNNFSKDVDTTASDVGKMHKSLENAGNGDVEIESSEAILVSQSDEKCVTTSTTSYMTQKNSTWKRDQSEVSDYLDLVKLEMLPKQLEAAIGITANIDEKGEQDESLSCLLGKLLSKASRIGDGNCQTQRKMFASVQRPNSTSKVSRGPELSGDVQKVTELLNLFRRRTDGQTIGDTASKKNEIVIPSELENSSETTLAGEETLGLKSLLNCIRNLDKGPPVKSEGISMYNETDQVCNGGSTKTIHDHPHLQNLEAKRKLNSMKVHIGDNEGTKSYESKEELDTGIPFMTHTRSITGQIKSKPSLQVPVLASKEDLKRTSCPFYAKEESMHNKVLISFLSKDVMKTDIFNAFDNCGPIVDIQEVSCTKGSNFKYAFIDFKTRRGLQNALKKTDRIVMNFDVIVEATSLADMPERMSVPNLIGDPEVPIALVKNPTRTIKVEPLTHDIISHQVEEALAFCGSRITGFFMGSSNCVAYVELETEDAKEKALAEHSIFVLGKQLQISRIDAPRTTVVRVSNVQPKCNILSVCSHYGKVKKTITRGKGIVDVHFKLTEWPNMLNILNSLNGKEVDGVRWIVQPATVFPPEVLRILWTQPDEKRHVKAALQNILTKLEEPVADFGDLMAKYYDKAS